MKHKALSFSDQTSLAFGVRSNGSFYPSYDTLYEYQDWSFTFIYLAIVILFCFLIAKKLIKTSLHKSLIVLFALSVFGIAAYLAIPPHAGLANYRMNWVEASFVPKSEFLCAYFLPNLLHKIFYFYPFLYAGLISLVFCCFLQLFLQKELKLEQIYTWMIGALFVFHPYILGWVSGEEDTFFVMTILLITLYAFKHGSNWFFLSTFTLTFLTRNQLVIIPTLLLLMDCFMKGAYQKTIGWKDGFKKFVVAIIPCGIYMAILSQIDANYYFNMSQDIEVMKAKKVDEFVITSFSMTFFLHFLWVAPLGMFIFLWLEGKIKKNYSNLIIALIFLFPLLVHEYLSFYYFNIRYLCHYLLVPCVLYVVAVLWFFKNSADRKKYWPVAFLILTITLIQGSPFIKGLFPKNEHQKIFYSLYQKRHEMYELTKDKHILIDVCGLQYKNYIRYLAPRAGHIFCEKELMKTAGNDDFGDIYIRQKRKDLNPKFKLYLDGEMQVFVRK
jgi:hypothetical protein